MKVYTRTGDEGTTSLVGGERVPKYDPRVEAYGTVDELMAFTALLGDNLRPDPASAGQVEELNRILCRLMTVAALLAEGEGCTKRIELDGGAVAWLEERIDAMQAAVPAVARFTIPGGHAAVSLCHVCRTVCRRAERAALRAAQQHPTAPEALAFLNRLSDYFYLLGRLLTARYRVEETLWNP